MSKFNTNKKGRHLLAFVSIIGLAAASHGSLLSEVATRLSRGLVPAAEAQELMTQRETLQREALPVEQLLREVNARTLRIEGRNAFLIDRSGARRTLMDGVYQHNNVVFLVENGIITRADGDGEGGGRGPICIFPPCEGDPDPEPICIGSPSDCDDDPDEPDDGEEEMRRRLDRLQPGSLDSSPLRTTPRTGTPNTTPTRFPGDHF